MSLNSFKTERLRLSIITFADLQNVFDTMNDRHTAEIISFLHWPMTMDQAESWCRKSEEGFRNKTDHLYLARDKQSNAPVGCIGLHCIGMHNIGKKGAETGYWIAPDWQGRGMATEMLGAMIDLAFGELGLDSLYATAAPVNMASRKVLEKQGFRQTGSTSIDVTPGKIAERCIFELEKNRHPVE